MSERVHRARRAFLKTVGLAAAALPFYKMLENDVVRAQTGTLPQKFVGVGMFHATTQTFYARRAGETDTSFDISYADSCLRPFDDAATYGSSFRDDIIVFEGFDYGVGEIGPTGGDLHVPMHGALGIFLTGSSATGGDGTDWNLQNESLDQYLAARHGGETPFRSVELCTEVDFAPLMSSSCIAYGAGGAPLARMTSPEAIWDRHFASLIIPNDEAARAAAERRRRVGASVLDFVAGDIQRLDSRLAGEERQKLDQHLTVVRDMERRLSDPVIAGMCSVPTRRAERGNPDPADDYLVSNGPNGGSPYFDLITDLQIELLAQMLICDLTRFGTIVLGNTAGEGTSPRMVAGLNPDDDTPRPEELAATGTDYLVPANFHDSIAHVSGSSRLEVQRAVACMNRYYFGKVARLMQRLRAANVLDSTLILVGNEGGHGAGHSTTHVPIVLAGGANGAITMGRRVVAPGRTAQIGEAPIGASRTSHNPILVAVANAFGEELEGYGTCADPALTAGVSDLI
ncbi:DUF1552 domain-containing protein [Sandaracinus amylolyticus]|uniref:DUF1552 domain-containing protein n=1 Tax=Sandaracinus amylolyticus TaxID=927083 RepID=UPI001F30ABE8|nr:DUF1552 domain-containing protein [Sandaracinus amylolyticus]UJR83275.1 Hypothetical protein I5071_53420 [Sandaracinus amylolyticus]